MPELPMAITQHPIGGIKSDAVEAKADALLQQVITGLMAHQSGPDGVPRPQQSGEESCQG